MKNLRNNWALVSGLIIYSFISLLIIFHHHHYYDDEIFNVSKMSWSLSEIFMYVQGSDVHPPLSYLINKILFDLFSSYKAILIFSIIINAGALGYFYNFSEKKLDDRSSNILIFIFVFLNGGLLLWTNSVRWYAYWVPLFIILYTYLLKYHSLTTKNIFIIALLLSVMTYINYLTFLVLIALFVCFVLLRRNDIKIKNILLFCLVYFSLSAYQIFIFISVHVHNKASQVYSNIFTSSLNAIYGIINGGSIFVADPIFLLFSVFTLLILIIGFRNIIIENKMNNSLLLYSILLLCILSSLMILTGVSGKYRNNIALSIPFYFILSYVIAYVKNQQIKIVYIIIVLIISFLSIFNLVTRTNTSKNSFNMPIFSLDKMLQHSRGKIIFTYDPSTFFYLSNKGYDIYYFLEDQVEINFPKETNIYLIQTYQGSLSDQKYNRIIDLYNNISEKIDIIKTEKIGIDKYYDIKNKLPENRPKIGKVQMYVLHGNLKNDLLIHPLEK